MKRANHWIPALILGFALACLPAAAEASDADEPATAPASPGARPERDEPAERRESGASTGDDDTGDGRDADAKTGDPAAPIQGETEYVVVTARPPFVPSSNTVTSKLPIPLQLQPFNVGTVTAPLLYDQDARNLNDALVNVSGVNPIAGFSSVHDAFTLRGFDSITSSLILTDGAPEPEVTFYQSYNVERVEVLKGPGGFLYGSNPLAGAINLVREQPLPGRFVRFNGSVGSYGYGEGDIDFNHASSDNDFRFRLNGMWRSSNLYRDSVEQDEWAVNPAFAWQIGDDSLLNVSLEYMQSERTPDSGIPLVNGALPDVDRQTFYGLPTDFSEQEVSRVQVDFENPLTGRVTVRDKFYFRGLDWQTSGTFFNGTFFDPNAGATVVNRAVGNLDDDQAVYGNQLELLFSADTGPVRHEFLAGLELTRYEDEFTLDAGLVVPDLDVFNPVPAFPPVVFPIPGQSQAGDATSDIIAPYFLDRIVFSEKIQALAGGRWDNLDFEEKVSGTRRDDSEFSPMLGFVYAPSTSLSFYAHGSESFAPPSARVVGPAEPEDSRQFEVGAKKQLLDGKMQLTFAVYDVQRDNIAIPDDNGFTQQTGDQEARGFEFELAAQPRRGMRAFFSYAYNDAELTQFSELIFCAGAPGCPGSGFIVFDRAGNTPAFAPENIANFWVAQSFAGGWGVGGGGRWVDEQFIAEDNSFTIDSYFTMDAAVFYDRKDWRYKLNIRNLLDAEYETRGFGSASVLPADPITVYASVQFRR